MTMLKDDTLSNKAKRLMVVVDAVLNEPGVPPKTKAVLILVENKLGKPEIHVTQNFYDLEAQYLLASVGERAAAIIKQKEAVRAAVKPH